MPYAYYCLTAAMLKNLVILFGSVHGADPQTHMVALHKTAQSLVDTNNGVKIFVDSVKGAPARRIVRVQSIYTLPVQNSYSLHMEQWRKLSKYNKYSACQLYLNGQ